MKLFSQLLQDARKSQEVAIVTLIKAPQYLAEHIGQHILLYPDGNVKGCMVDEIITRTVQQFLEEIKPAQPTRFVLPDLDEAEFFYDQLVLVQRAVVFGGGHISQPLVEFLYRVGYEVTIVDDRPDFANTLRFPDARQVLCCSFADAFPRLKLNRATAVVIVTRGHRHDLDCLRHVLSQDPFYIGMIGSRHKVATVFEALRQEGVGADVLKKVHAPIGLDINGKTPAEIALSIAAEIVAVAKGGSGLPLSSLRGGMLR